MLQEVVKSLGNRILPGRVGHAKEVLRFLIVVYEIYAPFLSINISSCTFPREKPDEPVRTISQWHIFLDSSSSEISYISSYLQYLLSPDSVCSKNYSLISGLWNF